MGLDRRIMCKPIRFDHVQTSSLDTNRRRSVYVLAQDCFHAGCTFYCLPLLLPYFKTFCRILPFCSSVSPARRAALGCNRSKRLRDVLHLVCGKSVESVQRQRQPDRDSNVVGSLDIHLVDVCSKRLLSTSSRRLTEPIGSDDSMVCTIREWK